jgi:hypothetical protein
VFFIIALSEMAELAVSIASVAAKHIWDALQASIEVNIQNQCSNFELTSPIYFCDNAVCDETPNQRVPSKDSTAAKFRVKFSRFMFQGGILYEEPLLHHPMKQMQITQRQKPIETLQQSSGFWRLGELADTMSLLYLQCC